MEVLRYCRDNAPEIRDYAHKNGSIDAIYALREMFNESGERNLCVADKFKNEPATQPSYMSLVDAVHLIDLVRGCV